MKFNSTSFLAAFTLASILPIAGCEGGKSKPRLSCAADEVARNGQCVKSDQAGSQCDEGFHLEGNKCVVNELTLEVVSQNACYQTSNGTTQLILQYITRDETGKAVTSGTYPTNTSGAYTTKLLIDGDDIDVESILNTDSELLRSNLAMSLVLDASVSMLVIEPAAFEPMKQAAMEVLQNTQQAWQTANSEFAWDIAWFDSNVYRPKANNAGDYWAISDIAYIPEPQSGTFTSLYKAVDYMIREHQDWYEAGVANGPRDQHVLVVFSDGKDNYSNQANNNPPTEGNYQDVLFWEQVAVPPVSTVADITDPSTQPNLRIHVLGMGSEVEESELMAIAEMGHGQYFHVSDRADLDELFAQLQNEIVTQQTMGIQTPLRAGEYTFELRTTRASDNATASVSWDQTAGEQLAACND